MNKEVDQSQLALMMNALKPKATSVAVEDKLISPLEESKEELEVVEVPAAKYPSPVKTEINKEFVQSIKEEFKNRKTTDPLTLEEIAFSQLLQLRRIAALLEQQRNISLGMPAGGINGEG